MTLIIAVVTQSGCGYIQSAVSSSTIESLIPVLKVDTANSQMSVVEGSSALIVFVLSDRLPTNSTINVTITSPRNDVATVFQPYSTQIVIPANSLSGSFVLNSNDDSYSSPNREFTVTFSTDSAIKIEDGSFGITITDNETPSQIIFASAAQNVIENAGTHSIPLSISPASTEPIVVSYSLGAGSATDGVDHFLFAGTVTIPALATSHSIALPVTDDSLTEPSETVILNLDSVASGSAAIGTTTTSYTATIIDNDIASFTITGVTGGTDVAADAYLNTTLHPVINWNAATGAGSYDVQIFLADGSTPVGCGSAVSVMATSYDFSSCSLTGGDSYKVRVTANGSTGGTLDASNSLYSFKVNRAPVAIDDGVYFALGATTYNVLSDNLASGAVDPDSDPDGDTFTITAKTDGTRGTVSFTGTSVTYTPNATEYAGTDSFTYTVSDGFGGFDTATVFVRIVRAHTWTGRAGAAGTGNWNVDGNWCGTLNANKTDCAGGGTLPTAADIVAFDGICSNCNVVMNTNVTVAGAHIDSSYPPTSSLVQNPTFTLNVGSAGYRQMAGSFVGGDANITVSGPINITGGSFQTTSATLNMNGNTLTAGAGTTFTHNSGTIYNPGRLNLPAGTVLNNFKVYGGIPGIASANEVTIIGTFDFESFDNTSFGGGGCVSEGTFNLQGDIILRGAGLRMQNHYCGPNGQLRINGSTDQTITNVSGFGSLMKTVVDKATGTLFMPATLDVRYQFEVAQGTLSGTTAVNFFGAYTYCGQNSRLSFGTYALSSLTIDQSCETLHIATPIQVTGNVIYNAPTPWTSTLNGTLRVAGNVEIQGYGVEGGTTGFIELNGSGAQTLTRTGVNSANVTPNFIINNSGMAGGFGVTLTSSYPLQNGRTFTISQGRLSLQDSTISLSVPGTLHLDAGTELTRNGGTLSYGTLTGTGIINP